MWMQQMMQMYPQQQAMQQQALMQMYYPQQVMQQYPNQSVMP
jgi:hypothetical protein